jgi:hypothetical protein
VSPGPRHSPRGDAHLALLDPSATPEEAAAIVAALERFMRSTGSAQRPHGSHGPSGWRLAGLLEGVGDGLETDLRHPWINT